MNIFKDSYGNSKTHKIYGMSQHPDSKNYIIMVFNNNDLYCGICGNRYMKINKWCKLCQINNLKANFKNWTSGSREIDNSIQGIQLKIKHHNDIIFEWIPYNHFAIINKKIDEGSY